MPLKTPIYRSSEEIENLVRAFEAGTLSPAEFNHHAHMTVAMWYLTQLPFPAALARMRTSIRQFAALHHQNNLYNETITVFWMKLLRHLLAVAEPITSVADTIYEILASWGSMEFIFKHYSKELAFSETARLAWVEPDLRPLGFA